MYAETTDSPDSAKQLDLIWLLLLTVLACATRIYGIGEWNYSADEWFTLQFLYERYTHLLNPAYYAFAVASFELFGQSEWSLRLPAAIFGIISVPVFFYTWRSVFGRNVAAVASLFIIFSDWHIWYSQFGRFYSGVFLFGSLSYYFYYKAFRQNNLKYMVWALLANAIAILFHATSLLIYASIGVFSLYLFVTRPAADERFFRRVAKVFLGLSALISLIAIPKHLNTTGS